MFACVCTVRAGRTLVFTGNLTSPDYFHELLLDGDSLIVGARCVLLHILHRTHLYGVYGWLRGTAVERWSLTGEISLSYARPRADW